MNNRCLVRYGILFCALLPQFPHAAGLDLADAPMFVTEVLAPNVVISPVYLSDFNESVLKDVPWSDTAQSGVLSSTPWSESPLSIGRTAFRVTPWPNTVMSTPTTPNGCHIASNVSSYACSETSLYNADITVSASNEVFNFPLNYTISSTGTLNTYNLTNYYGQEIYPQKSTATWVDPRYVSAKSRYFHSDSNFLYFNPVVANTGAYQPWPSLGGGAFVTYGNDAKARYSPLRADAGSVSLNVFLDNWLILKDVGAVNSPAYVGQFWKKTGTRVIDADSFTGTCWELNGETTSLGCTNAMTDPEKAQFANWFTYWRSSNLATRGMMGNLFDRLRQADLLDKFRFGLSNNVNGAPSVLGFYSVDGSAGDTRAAKINNLLQTIRNNIYSDSTRFNAAWKYTATNDRLVQDDAYRDTNGGPLRSCRRNYEILLTPDYSILSYAIDQRLRAPYQAAGNADNLPNVPFPDANDANHANMWSDVGAQGWATDLRGDLENTILPSLRDEATYQHVVRYIIGPNAEGGRIFPKGALNYERAIALATTATSSQTWPAKPTGGINNEFADTYDDLWHMALNSHGYYYPSDNVKDAVTNLLDAFNDIITRSVSGSSVATNTTSLQSGGQIYQATVESDWKGHLRAYSFAFETQTINGVARSIGSVNYGTPVWDVAEKVSAASTRRIFTYNRETGAGVPFKWDAIGTPAQTILKSSFAADDNQIAKAQTLVDYLRGSGTCEDRDANSCNAGGVPYSFRRRNLDRNNLAAYSLTNPNGRNVLGDISNSNPWYVTPPPGGISDVDYPGYNAHRVNHKGRLSVLYVGANDGMLHAIQTADTVDANGNVSRHGGEELFAYIPSFVQDNLPQLADPAYGHKFFVDGSPFSSEVYIDHVGWRTVLAGGANKGGMGYYLLDVTDPVITAENASTAAGLVRWEFTHPQMYYTFNLPVAFPTGHARVGQARQIALMNNGKWALIVGNGYATDPGKQACLFVINLSGPSNGVWTENTDYRKLCVGRTDYRTADGAVPGGGLDTNGLSTPTPYDLNGDGKVDIIYAGDLNGNVWRFDVSDADSANWTVPSSPLFVAVNDAGQRQPIVAPPEVTLHTVGNLQGQLVLVGTGKYIEASDRSNTNVQSFYGIWDRNDAAFTNITRNYLYQQSFVQESSGGVVLRKQPANSKVSVAYCTGTNLGACNGVKTVATDKMGWYWDMGDDVDHDKGERLTGRVSLYSGIVFFNTFYSVLDATGELDPCQYGATGWIMGLNAASGYMEDQLPVFDVNRDGVIDSHDVMSAGVKVGAAIGGTTFARGADGSRVGVYSPTNLGTAASEGKKMTIVINPGTGSSGRVSWYELVD